MIKAPSFNDQEKCLEVLVTIKAIFLYAFVIINNKNYFITSSFCKITF